MRSSVGPPVVGEDFFDRETELRQLAARIRDGNHVLLTGQRRMGKTSIAKELGARLERKGWVFLYIDVEGETSEEAMIANLAEAVHPVRAVSSRLARSMKEWVGKEFERVEEISAFEFGVKVRSGLNQVTWRQTSLLPAPSGLRSRTLPMSTGRRCSGPQAKWTFSTTRSAFTTLWQTTATSRSP